MATPDAAADSCPKQMVHGPCGGVGFDGSCEVGSHRCGFLDRPTVAWQGDGRPSDVRTPAAAATRALLAQRPFVIVDFPARPLDATSLTACARTLAGSVDAVLVGDSGQARVQFPPAYRASLIMDHGLRVWSGINNRDRNRVALEGELAALAHLGVAAVHCVTGDHTALGHRPDARPVFDLDSTRTAALAREAGHLVSVGEAPATPPVGRRVARLAEKERAGADLCFVNHCGGVGPTERFIAEARDAGVRVGFLPCVPVIVDEASARSLQSFPSLVLPEGYLDRILAAGDTRAEGIALSVELAAGFLALDGVVGVDLSGGAGVGAELGFAEVLAEIGTALAPVTAGRAGD